MHLYFCPQAAKYFPALEAVWVAEQPSVAWPGDQACSLTQQSHKTHDFLVQGQCLLDRMLLKVGRALKSHCPAERLCLFFFFLFVPPMWFVKVDGQKRPSHIPLIWQCHCTLQALRNWDGRDPLGVASYQYCTQKCVRSPTLLVPMPRDHYDGPTLLLADLWKSGGCLVPGTSCKFGV